MEVGFGLRGRGGVTDFETALILSRVTVALPLFWFFGVLSYFKSLFLGFPWQDGLALVLSRGIVGVFTDLPLPTAFWVCQRLDSIRNIQQAALLEYKKRLCS